MKFAGVIAFVLTALPTVFGAAVPENTLQARDASSDAIVASIKRVNGSLTTLDGEIIKVNSADLTQLLAVNTAAQNLAGVLQTETTNVQGLANTTDIIGALGIQLATSDLISATQKVSKDIVAIKQYVDQAGVTAVVLQALQQQKTLADTYGATVTSKIPSLFQVIGQLDQQQVDAALDDAIKAYSS